LLWWFLTDLVFIPWYKKKLNLYCNFQLLVFSLLALPTLVRVRCGRILLQSTLVVDLLIEQVLEGEPVPEGQLQHLKVINEITSQCKIYKSYLFKVLKIGAQLDII